MPPHDVVVVGGGPAGLSAALVLGRCRRRVLVIDGGEYRNAAARHVHGLLGHDGVPPAELRRVGRQEVRAYGVELEEGMVEDASPLPGGFEVRLAGGGLRRGRFLLLATGVRDGWPSWSGLPELIGISVFHCPLCDGWEQRDAALAAHGAGASGVELALGLTTWSRDVVLLGDGGRLSAKDRARLEQHGIAYAPERVEGLDVTAGRLVAVRLAGGGRLERSAVFCHGGLEQRSELARRLGCGMKRGGTIRVDRLGQSTVPGVYVAGDAAGDVLLAAVAIAEGAKCAFAINKALREAERP